MTGYSYPKKYLINELYIFRGYLSLAFIQAERGNAARARSIYSCMRYAYKGWLDISYWGQSDIILYYMERGTAQDIDGALALISRFDDKKRAEEETAALLSLGSRIAREAENPQPFEFYGRGAAARELAEAALSAAYHTSRKMFEVINKAVS